MKSPKGKSESWRLFGSRMRADLNGGDIDLFRKTVDQIKKKPLWSMIATFRESKTRLSELVSIANSGEEILITVHGRPKARILPVSEPHSDTADWLRELSDLRSSLGQTSTSQKPSALEEVREDRW